MRGIPMAMVAFAVLLGVLGCGKSDGNRTQDRGKTPSSAAQPGKRPAIGGGPSEYDGGSSTDTSGTGATGSTSTGPTGTGTAGSTGSPGSSGRPSSEPGTSGDIDDDPRYEWTTGGTSGTGSRERL